MINTSAENQELMSIRRECSFFLDFIYLFLHFISLQGCITVLQLLVSASALFAIPSMSLET